MTIVHKAYAIEGLAADTKPTTNVEANRKFFETDTGNMFNFNGATWDVYSIATARFMVVVPRFAKSTTSSETFSFDGGPSGLGVDYIMPHNGRVTEITVSHTQSMGNGFVRLVSNVNFTDQNFTNENGQGFITFNPTDWNFLAGLRLNVEIMGDGFSASPVNNVGITLAMEFDLV